MRGSRPPWILLLFFLSGITGLVYEIVWVRMLTAIFGHTVYAVSTVLTAFMAGLGLGSYLFGRRADRFREPLRVYAALELGIAAFALLVPWLLGGLDAVFGPVYRSLNASFYVFSLLRFLVCFAILIVPTTLMGATLPVLSKAVAQRFRALGRQIGLLYAVNTLGAVLGCFVTGFVLLEALGIRTTIAATAALNVALAVASWMLSKLPAPEAQHEDEPAAPSEAGGPALSAGSLRIVLLCFGISGFVALALEVIWTRSLVFSFFQGSSTYAFSTMLTVFLLGLGGGSLIAAPLVDRVRNPVRLFAWMELGIGIAALASGPLLLALGRAHVGEPLGTPWLAGLTSDFLRSAAVMIVPTLLMGAIFPVVTRIYVTQMGRVARGVGTLYFFNTFGSIVGSFAAGFVLIPFLGMTRGLFLLGAVSLALAVALMLADPRRAAAPGIAVPAVAVASLVVGLVMIPLGAPHQHLAEGETLVYYEEGKNGTVSVVDTRDGSRWIAIDNVYVAGNSRPMMTDQKSLAHVPALFHPDPERVLTVGFGSGGASWSFTTHPGLDEIHCVEIAPEVVDAHTFFPDCNFTLFDDPRYSIIYDDAKSYLLLDDTLYDVISTDCTDLRYKSNADLYTLDYFRTCKRRLTDDGLLVVWMPLTGLDEFHYKVVLATFAEVFPEGTLWYFGNYPTNYILLIGSEQPLAIDWSELTRRMTVPAVREDLQMIDLDNPYKLLASFLLDAESLRRLVEGFPLNTDDRPIVEFGVPKLPAATDYMGNLEATMHLRGPVMPPVVGIPEENREQIESDLRRHVEAGRHIARGHLHLLRGRPDSARHEYRRALRLTPEDNGLRETMRISRARERAIRDRIAQDPGDLGARVDLALLLWETGDFEGVVTQTDAVLQARPLDPMATLMSARGMEMLGRFDEARTRLETLQSADLAPQQAARLRLALDANALSHEISETGSVDAVVRLADLYLRHGEVLEAVEVLESPAAETDSMAVLDRLAYLYIRMHLVDDAEATAGRILALEPGRPEGHYYLAQVHLARDDLSGAEREFLAISEPAGRNASAWFLGAVIFQLQGREDDAFRALEQAVVLGGQDILRQAGGHPALATSRALERVLGASSGAR